MGQMNRKQRRAEKKQGKPSPGLGQALQLHQAGQLDAAEKLYRQVLAAQPDHADANYLLGVICAQRGQFDQAMPLIGRAIEINPNAAAYHSHMGNVLRGLGQFDRAVQSCRRALALQPDYPEALYNLGNSLLGLGQLEQAAASYGRALSCKPDLAEAWIQLAHCQRDLSRWDDAIASYRRYLLLRPNDPDAFAAMGLILQHLGHLGDASACLRRAIELAPVFAAAHNNLGKVLHDLGQWEQSAAHCRRAVALQPQFHQAHHNLGLALHALGQWDQALASISAALTIKPDFAEALNSLGAVRQVLDQPVQAQAAYAQAIAIDPNYAEAHANLGQVLLLQGQWAAGWEHYEWRWQMAAMRATRRYQECPQWQGEDGAGRTLLIHAEQGFGDSLQFCRYAALAARRGWQVVVQVPGPLVRLLSTLEGVVAVIEDGQPPPPFHMQCPMLSLPRLFDTIPSAPSYLRADPQEVAAWSSQVAGEGTKIGLVWAGSARRHAPQLAAVDARRSMSAAQMAPLLSVPGCRFYSLQKEGPDELPVHNPMAQVSDFAQTAALIANLDLVISVDTAVAHLAAALGKPVWLLNRFDSCWRWLRGQDDSPWYPTLRQFRQSRPGQWPDVIEAVRAELKS